MHQDELTLHLQFLETSKCFHQHLPCLCSSREELMPRSGWVVVADEPLFLVFHEFQFSSVIDKRLVTTEYRLE